MPLEVLIIPCYDGQGRNEPTITQVLRLTDIINTGPITIEDFSHFPHKVLISILNHIGNYLFWSQPFALFWVRASFRDIIIGEVHTLTSKLVLRSGPELRIQPLRPNIILQLKQLFIAVSKTCEIRIEDGLPFPQDNPLALHLEPIEVILLIQSRLHPLE